MYDETLTERRPGILVVHGGAGLDAHAEGRAQRLAALGYVVFACDMYGDGVAGDRRRVMACINELRAAHVAAFVEEMNQAAADWQLIVYGGAMHGFTHETATGQTPGVLYHALSDARSSAAIRRFLEELFAR